MAQAQRNGEWNRHFPVGALLSQGSAVTLPKDGATSSITVSGMNTILRNHNAGLIENNLNYVVLYLGSPYFHEEQNDIPGAIEANDQHGSLWCIFQAMGRRTAADPNSSLRLEFTQNTGVANTREVADPLVQTVINDLGDHPSILCYFLDDDQQTSADPDRAARNHTLVRSFQALDPHGRPATAMWRDRGYADLGSDCKLIVTYEYPCGRTSGAVDTLEGDFHRSTFGTITGTSNPDWVDVIRHRVALLPVGARHMWMLQAHYTNTGTASRLRQPTDRELRKQFWCAVGEGATGLFWFLYTDFDIGGGGGVQPMLGARASAMAVAKELSNRLTRPIRQRLLGSTALGASTTFTTSGGGTSGLTTVDYTSAYVGELVHEDGTVYVVVCNHNTATASVTVSHPSRTGYLVSLETGARYKLGTDAISLPALDGTMLQYEPTYGRHGRRGVPDWDVDLTKDVETWWSSHWANPTSANYVAAANVTLHTNTVTVPVGGDLQAYVDAAPDNTTFVLAAGGTYGVVTMIERNGLHFTSADTGNKAVCRGFKIYGSVHAQQYNSSGTSFGFVSKLYSGTDPSLTSGGVNSIRSQALERFFRKPSRDFVFDNLAFVADPAQPVVYYRKFQIAATWQTDHWYEGTPVAMRCVEDVLVQSCTVNNYVWGSDNAAAGPTNDPQQNNTGPVSHPGLIWGNAGIRNIVIRNSTFTLATNAANTGSPSVSFFDGAQGYVAYGNTVAGKQNQDTFNFLINDDYTGDFRNPGVIDRLDMRMSRYCVIAANTVTPTGSPTLVSFSGERLLVKGNTVNVGTGTIPTFVNLDTKVCRLAPTNRCRYLSYGSVIDSNAITANAVTTFVEHNTAVGYNTLGLTSSHPWKSLVGQTTIKNNTVTKTNLSAGSVSHWQALDASSTIPAETPITIRGHTILDLDGLGPTVTPMAITSRGLPVEDSGGFGGSNAAANAVDSDYGTLWRLVNVPSAGSPQRIAVDISSVSNTNKTSSILAWYNDPRTGDYYQTAAQTSSTYNTQPRDYKIQGHTGAGGGAAPAIGDAGWVDLVTVTGNTRHSKQHLLTLTNYNWLQLRFTAANGATGVNDDVSLQLDIHNVAAGNVDNWIFFGDSITAEAFGRKNIDNSNWTNGPLAALIHTALPAQYPLMENGGVSGQNIAYMDTNKATLLSGFTGQYVGIAFGANDASGPTTATSYYTSLLSVVDYVIGLGKTPIVPKITQRTDGAGVPDGYVVQYNAKIDDLYVARPTVIRGPDLYAKVADGTIPLRDGLHPTYVGAGNGYEKLLEAWRDALLANVYA